MASKDKKMLILLILVVAITFIVLYFVYFKKAAGNYFVDALPESQSGEIDLGVLSDERFEQLIEHGTLPVTSGKTGNPNPFR